jgi:hypothetical protein
MSDPLSLSVLDYVFSELVPIGAGRARGVGADIVQRFQSGSAIVCLMFFGFRPFTSDVALHYAVLLLVHAHCIVFNYAAD